MSLPDDLEAFVAHKLAVRAQRSARAREMTAARSEKVRAGIRLAIAARPTNQRGLCNWVMWRLATFGPKKFGLDRVPDRATVADVIRQMEINRLASELKPANAPENLRHASAIRNPPTEEPDGSSANQGARRSPSQGRQAHR